MLWNVSFAPGRAVRGALLAVLIAAPAARLELNAQESALASMAGLSPLVQYSRNESGGSISVVSPARDSASVEAVRMLVLESAAAVRRGDIRSLRLVGQNQAAMQILADQRGAVRCTVRLTPRGGDLVLLSDDQGVIAAIHQLLTGPPATVRL